MVLLLDLATEIRQTIWKYLLPDNLNDLTSVCRVSQKIYEEASYVLYHGRKVYFTINPRNRYRHIQVRGLGYSRSFRELGRYEIPWHKLSTIRINFWGLRVVDSHDEVNCAYAQLFSIRHMARSIVYLLKQSNQLPDLEFRFLESRERSWWLWFDDEERIMLRTTGQLNSANVGCWVSDLDSILCLFRTLRGARSARIWLQRPHEWSKYGDPELNVFSRFLEDSTELKGEFNWPEPFTKALTREAPSRDTEIGYTNLVAAIDSNTAIEIHLMVLVMLESFHYADEDLELEKIMHSSIFLKKFEYLITHCASLPTDGLNICREWLFSHRCEQKFYADHYHWRRISSHLRRNLKGMMPRDWMVGKNFIARHSSAGICLKEIAKQKMLNTMSEQSPETTALKSLQLLQKSFSAEALQTEWPGNEDQTAFMTYWCVT